MKQGKKIKIQGFTLVELLVTLSILATVSIVSYISYAGYIRSSHNATRVETIDSLHLTLGNYLQQKNTLPEPNSNYIAYDERGSYMHTSSGSTKTYGVSGYVSDTFLPNGYMNFEATDPDNKQFYGYGKLTDNTAFDIAAVLYDEKTGGYKTYLRGTYQREQLASLIRSYSSSNFVSQDSTENLPYNPYERKITATISYYSGILTLTNNNGTIANITSPATYTGELSAGDTILLSTGSTALVHISDGSELSLGSTTSQTELVLNTLAYSDDNNLVSKVALWLKSGEVWTEAPHLRTEVDSASDFSIQTDSALAAVRGTVFGMTKNPSVTKVALEVGKIEVQKITTIGGKITSNQAFTDKFNSTGGFVLDTTSPTDMKSYMIVPEGGTPIEFTIMLSATATGTLNPFEIDQKIYHPDFSFGYRPKTNRVVFSTGAVGGTSATGILAATFYNPGADSYEVSFGTGEIDQYAPFPDPNSNLSHTGTLSVVGPVTVTGTFAYISESDIQRTYTLRLCFRGRCSMPEVKVLGGDVFSFDRSQILQKQKCPTGQSSFPPFGCMDEHLVTYAPYDDDGDLAFYRRSPEIIPMTQTGILNRPLYRGWNTASGIFASADSGSVRPLNYPDGLFKSLHNAFYKWGDTKGVLVVTASGGTGTGSLKYDLTPLNLTGSYSIEMNVRGAALKRTTGHYLLNDTNGFRLFINGGKLTRVYLPFGNHTLTITGSLLSDISFYRVILERTPNYDTLRIVNTSEGINWSSQTGSTIDFGSGDTYIGSAITSTVQWNDIIDSVKVYQY